MENRHKLWLAIIFGVLAFVSMWAFAIAHTAEPLDPAIELCAFVTVGALTFASLGCFMSYDMSKDT
jgi:hypothetical protein